MYCAANGEKLSRIPEIARAYGVSELFLLQDSAALTRAGLVETVRGRNGGVRCRSWVGRSPFSTSSKSRKTVSPMAECFEAGEIDCPLVDSCGLNAALAQGAERLFRSASGIHDRRPGQGQAADQLPPGWKSRCARRPRPPEFTRVCELVGREGSALKQRESGTENPRTLAATHPRTAASSRQVLLPAGDLGP